MSNLPHFANLMIAKSTILNLPEKMEADGAVKIFARSIDSYGLKYAEYLGDGDSKAYNAVCDAKVYGEQPITKLECTGHIQKRMGKALLDLVSVNRNNKFVVDKHGKWLANKIVANKSRGEKLHSGIGGIGRLTVKSIKSIQGHYGAAVRSNDALPSMTPAIWAIFNHRNGDHSTCPEWCALHNGDTDEAKKSTAKVCM